MELIDEQIAASQLGLSPRTLQAWRARGEGPPYRKLGRRRVLYERHELEAWADQRRRDPQLPINAG